MFFTFFPSCSRCLDRIPSLVHLPSLVTHSICERFNSLNCVSILCCPHTVSLFFQVHSDEVTLYRRRRDIEKRRRLSNKKENRDTLIQCLSQVMSSKLPSFIHGRHPSSVAFCQQHHHHEGKKGSIKPSTKGRQCISFYLCYSNKRDLTNTKHTRFSFYSCCCLVWVACLPTHSLSNSVMSFNVSLPSMSVIMSSSSWIMLFLPWMYKNVTL